MAKRAEGRKEGLGETLAASVRAQVKAGLAPLSELGVQIGSTVDEAVMSATAGLRSMGPLVTAAVRDVADVDTLKALADPTRLAILRVLTPNRNAELPVMSAKELAEALDEPQTKLYRHLKVLEAAGLIEVAETRIVSGIVETRYRAAQHELRIDPGHDGMVGEEFVAVISALITDYHDELVRYALAGRIPYGENSPEGYGKGSMITVHRRMSTTRADEFRQRLAALVEEMDAEPNDPDGVQVNMLSCWYSPLPE